MDPVRFAVVGAGGFARTHLRAISHLEQEGTAELAAVVIRRPGHYAEQVSELQERGVRIHDSLDSLLSAGGCDIVCLPTGIHLHVPQTEACLRSGNHVVCEKPLAPRIQDADRMVSAAHDSDRHVIIGYQAVFTHAIQTIKARILQGRIGRVSRICVKGGWPRDDAYYARNAWAGRLRDGEEWVLDSPINNAFAHDVNNPLDLCGPSPHESATPASVQAELYHARKIESPDTASLRILTTEGVEIVIALSHVTSETLDPSFVIHGENGTARSTPRGGATTITYHDGTEESFDNGGVNATPLPFYNAVEAFHGQADVLCTPDNARAQTLCINGAHESCPSIADIPDALIEEVHTTRPDGQETRCLSVQGLDDLIHRSFEEGKLFSELGADWAQGTEAFDVTRYEYFPGRD